MALPKWLGYVRLVCLLDQRGLFRRGLSVALFDRVPVR
jgi:hypothetical protein